ncbi:MAG TPA: hypothetical protein VMV81_01580, partial [Phycisphaerae bacterium]|nr:hypothetical protein [Phycisphaerae bacterium]
HRLFDETGTGKAGKAERKKTLPLLSDYLSDWRRRNTVITGDEQASRTKVLSQNDEYTVGLLLSMYNLLRPDGRNGLQISRNQGRGLDAAHEVTKRTALLIGWSDEACPVRLERDLVAMVPNKSRTIYRFVIPIEKK